MTNVRAKFNVAEITRYGNSGGGKVILMAVIGGDNPENKEFWKQTPSGKIELLIDNPEAMKQFDFGEYYIDFQSANQEEADDVLKYPVRYPLSEIFKRLKFGRPAENQKYLDKCIAELEK